MIINLTKAQKIDPDIEQEELDALEAMVRGYTNNTFMELSTRTTARITGTDTVADTSGNFLGYKEGDTVQITRSERYDGLATITSKTEAAGETVLQLEGVSFEQTARPLTFQVTKVIYPPDVVVGVKKLIKYDKATAGRAGLKSRSISRWSESYADPSSGNFIEGYPAGMIGFLHNHRRMRWD